MGGLHNDRIRMSLLVGGAPNVGLTSIAAAASVHLGTSPSASGKDAPAACTKYLPVHPHR